MLSIYTLEQTEQWDAIVKSFKAYDVYYLSGYAKAFQIHGDGEPILFYYDDGNTRAINVVMKRDIAKAKPLKDKIALNTWFDISTPYGYGGFWVEGENYISVEKAFDKYCQEQGFVSDFVRFHLFSDYLSYYSGKIETHTSNVVRTLDLSLDEILRDFEHKVRKNLKRAATSSLDIEIDTTGERIDDFLNIYYSTMERTSAKEDFFFSREFFEAINKMEGNYVYLHVLNEGQVISTELVLYGTENCYSFLGGTNNEYFHLRPNDFLKYEIIKWAKENNFKRFVLGGGYGSDDGIFKYKKSFAPKGVCSFYIGKKIFDNDKYQRLIKMNSCEGAALSTFFPKYRAT